MKRFRDAVHSIDFILIGNMIVRLHKLDFFGLGFHIRSLMGFPGCARFIVQ